jgi:Sec-independent protein translocase protein TatA
LGIAVVALIVLVIVALVAIPILARVLGEATRRNPDRPDGEGDEVSRREEE